MRLLLIDNYDSFTFNLYHGLKPWCGEIRVMRNDDEELLTFNSFDAMVISPGPGLPEEAGYCLRMLKNHIQKPVLGICLGHQAIIEFYGGKLINLKDVLHGKARECVVIDEQDPIYHNVNQRFMAGRYHSWVADPSNIPNELQVTAIDESSQVMSVRHKNLPAWGIQYHPESVLTPCGSQILRNWAGFAKQYTGKK
jgi:anthranilate synthase component II